ncbi:MAG: HNH endonuclease [Planctomycetales bacterium]|nr:HNH endonuclease [Planctomycetales bacterium]
MAAFQIDHIRAEKHGGKTQQENLALACFQCNNHKGPNIASVDSQTNKLEPLFDPRTQNWNEHFRWDGPRLVGLTGIGRVTIAVLDINQPERVALRQALIAEGVFPPPMQT